MRHAVVTGGSHGIGRAIAEALAADGYRLTLVARGREALEATLKALPGDGHAACAFDVTDEAAWGHVDGSRVDGLVCAAGILGPIGSIEEVPVAELRRTLDINVVGTVLAVRHCLPGLRAARGSVVTLSGGGATSPLPRYDAYAASKAAVARLTENLAMELAPIAVNCVAPGFVATRMHDATVAAGPERAGAPYYERTIRDLEGGGVPAAEAAELVRLLISGVAFTGKLVSAQWDPWREEEFRARLAANPALGTIRRIDDVFFSSAPERNRA